MVTNTAATKSYTIGNNPKKCLVAGHQMIYYRAGQGEVVLLVHGITTYSFIWRQIFTKLAQKYDVIAVDLLGCGDSDMPLDISYAIKDHAERLHEFVSKLSIDRFHYVGHDLGGGMGQIFAVKHPDMLYDLTLLNSVAYDFWPVQPIIAIRTPIIRFFMMASLDLGTFKLLIRHGIYHKDRIPPELVELFMKPLLSSNGRKAFMHFAKCLDNHNLMEITPDLQKLPMPVLIIRGDKDPYLSSEIAAKLAREIPDSRLIISPTASHFIQEDEPAFVLREILNFIGQERA